MKFTIQEAKKIIGEEKAYRLVNMLHSNVRGLTVKNRVIYVPHVTRHGTETEMRKTVSVFDMDEVLAMYSYRVENPLPNHNRHIAKYKRALEELTEIKEYLDENSN